MSDSNSFTVPGRSGHFSAPLRWGVALTLALLAGQVAAQEWTYPYPASLKILDGYKVLHLKGSPEDLGRQHGVLARQLVQQVLNDVILQGEASSPEAQRRLFEGAMVMEQYLPEAYRRELRALAKYARVDYEALVALQLFGDVQRSQYCSSYALYGPATRTGELIAGRNMDYWDNGASKYGAMLICYYPDEGIPFVTVTWAGIINGWTLMNACGVVVSNNTAWGGKDSLEGISTCFMLRKVAQFAHTVQEGVDIIQSTPRSCGTVMLVAGGNPPNAAQVEFDHEQVAVRWAEKGYVLGTNEFRELYRNEDRQYYWECSRYRKLRQLIEENYGSIDWSMNFAAASGVPIESINLHSALLFPAQRTISVSMGATPACKYRYRSFRFTPDGLIALNETKAGVTAPEIAAPAP